MTFVTDYMRGLNSRAVKNMDSRDQFDYPLSNEPKKFVRL